MPDTITARLSEPISRPELSRMWESEREAGDGVDMRASAPELVLETDGNDVRLSFPSGSRDPEHRKLKEAFERAVHRYQPNVKVEWKEKTRTAR
jgi:hypothetical protein